MLVAPDWCRLMARYNAWQNEGLLALAATLPPEELTRERGAWFGSILATLSHVLWADRVWLGRVRGAPPRIGGIPESVSLAPTREDWAEGRLRADRDLAAWAEELRDADLDRDLTWTNTTGTVTRTRPLALVVTHMFNHQTHHRGQVHAMLTAAGARPQSTDLITMPD